MLPPPPTAAIRHRRRTITVVALILALSGAFVWGLVMFAVGHITAQGAQSALDEQRSGAVLTQLTHLDQALSREDVALSTQLIAQLATSSDAQVVNALSLRRHALTKLEETQRQRAKAADLEQRISASLTRLCDADVHLISLCALPAKPQQLLGISQRAVSDPVHLMVSNDGGASWHPDERFDSSASRAIMAHFATNGAFANEVVVIRPELDRELGWWSHDGGATFQAIPIATLTGIGAGAGGGPAQPLPGDRAHFTLRAAVTGKNGLVIVMNTGEQEFCARTNDGGQSWKAGAKILQIPLLIPSPTETCIFAMTGDHGAVVSSHDLGDTFSKIPIQGDMDVCNDTASMQDGAESLHALPAHVRLIAARAVPGHHGRWYLLGNDGLWRTEDDGRHWLLGRGRLGQLRGTCLAFTVGPHPTLLVGGDGVWSLHDSEEPTLFLAAPAGRGSTEDDANKK